jgi:DNA-3-methyladenine glycosylase II
MTTTPDPDPWGSPDDEVVWLEAFEGLGRHPRFGPLVAGIGPVRLPPPDPSPFRALTRSIVFQQLAGKAAATIWGRVEAVVGGSVTPEAVRGTDDQALRGAGLSRAKLAAIRDLGARVEGGSLDFGSLPTSSDDEVLKLLTTVRGIGPWTARMHLIFQLRRPDIWPVGDLGIRVGWARIHALDTPPDARGLEPLADPLRPWRSAVAWYCWRVVDAGLEVP